jgi:dihydrofolate reductase
MGAIKVHEFISMDGVIEDPSWTMGFGFDPKMGDALARLTGDCTAILLGRKTYEMFEPVWSTRTAADDPGAEFFNDTDKFVVSSTLTNAKWSHSSVIGAYDPATITGLKTGASGGIYVSGSATLVRAMLADGLVDELHLFVYPVALGRGQRLFADGTSTLRFELSESQTYANGVLHLVYLPEVAS